MKNQEKEESKFFYNRNVGVIMSDPQPQIFMVLRSTDTKRILVSKKFNKLWLWELLKGFGILVLAIAAIVISTILTHKSIFMGLNLIACVYTLIMGVRLFFEFISYEDFWDKKYKWVDEKTTDQTI